MIKHGLHRAVSPFLQLHTDSVEVHRMRDNGKIINKTQSLPIHRKPELQGVGVVLERLPYLPHSFKLLRAQGIISC